MFGSNKPVVLESYGRRRSRWRPPRWAVLLASGVAIGVLGVLVAQEKYLPPRLSASDSAKLRSDYATADSDRTRLRASLDDTTRKLNTALADKKALSETLATSNTTIGRLREDVAAAVAGLPADPRGGSIEVRAAKFAARGNTLSYDVVLTRERASRPMPAALQLIVSGDSGKGSETTVALQPVSLTIGSHEIVRGSQALPDGFRPRQTTVQVLDRVGGKSLGMRVMLVK